MENKIGLIIVKAKIRLRTAAEGGRSTPIKSGYRPNHILEKSDTEKLLKTHIGDIQFDDQEFIQPGETKIVTVRFLRVAAVEKHIHVGLKWLINEGSRTIADGEIIE